MTGRTIFTEYIPSDPLAPIRPDMHGSAVLYVMKILEYSMEEDIVCHSSAR